VKHTANRTRPPTGASPKATKTPDPSGPTSERNKSSAPRRPELRRTAASWDSHRPAARFQPLLFTVAGLALLPAAAATLMRLFPPSEDASAQLAAFIPYGLVGYLLALACLLAALMRARHRLVPALITVIVAILTACHLAWLAPLFVDDHRPAATPTFQLMTLNMFNGEADSSQVAERAAKADVVILVETTSDALRALERYGWDNRFPYSVGDPRNNLSNTAVYSRFPLSRSGQIGDSSFQQWLTTVRIPGIGGVRLMAVHPCNPYCGENRWNSEHRLVRRTVIDNIDRPLVVAGDFNSVNDHGPMQALQRAGLKSATDVAGAGWLPTYPANRLIPPLLPIDHVLINKDLTATSVTSFAVSGSDHRGLLATLAGAR
jgi:endonuclease/exonuclease/phosphatase (EEP) superfamily protein YafD